MAFFEQIGKHLTDASQNVAQQTKNIADVSKMNSAISEREKRILQLYSLIGQSYYDRHKNDCLAEEMDKIVEINALFSEISDFREKIKQIKGVTKCQNCGADVPADASFCNACGTKVIRFTESYVKETRERRCPACNTVVDKDNLFCNNCGKEL